ncbi:MAG: FAD binding domain-containing protein [Thermomicrobiales bacterium]
MLDRFALHQPQTVEEASQMLAAWGEEATIYAGGTELLIVMKERLASFSHLVDIKRIPALRQTAIDPVNGVLHFGATTTHREIERSPEVRRHLPAFAAMAAQIANVRVRVAGTIGGNLCFAEPHSDPATLLTALDATLTLASAAGRRQVAMADFTTGLMATDRQHDELLTLVSIPIPGPRTGVAYERFKLHERPTAAIAAVIAITDGVIARARLVAGSVGERPQTLSAAARVLEGAPVSVATIAAACETVRDEVETVADVFESEAYKRQLARAMASKAIARALKLAGHMEGGRHAA